jgi:hypothetical protein
MNGENELLREKWAWRGFAIFMLILNLLVTIITNVQDINRHAADNYARAQHWQKLEDGVDRNSRMILTLDDHMRECLRCHAHEPRLLESVKKQGDYGFSTKR